MQIPTGFTLIPTEGDPTTARVARKIALATARALLGWTPRGIGPGAARALGALQRSLVGALRRRPDEVLGVIASVDVGPLVRCGVDGLRPPLEVLDALIPNLLFALGRAGVAREASEATLWDRPVAQVVDGLSGVVARFDPAAQGLLLDPSGVEARLASGRRVDLVTPGEGDVVSDVLLPLGAALPGRLALVDTFPLALDEAHPDKAGNALSLGGRPVAAWREGLEGALGLIAATLPTWHAELPQTLARVVPVGYEPERHLSASYREAPGLIYVTLHPSTLTMAEAIVHEVQHGKLNALSWLDPVLTNGHSEWTASPVRPDLRPIMGVLLAAHAFVPVAALHAALAASDHPLAASPELARRRAEVLASNDAALATLRRLARPTAVGRRVLDALVASHDALVAMAPAELRPEGGAASEGDAWLASAT